MQEDDVSAFRDEMVDVTPCQHEHKTVLGRPLRRPGFVDETRRHSAVFSKKHDSNYLATDITAMVGPCDLLEWRKTGIQDSVYRKLRLGKLPIEASLDLHHMTVAQAREAVFKFIHTCQQANLRTVVITHGKGIQSPVPAKLKSFVNHWLPQLPAVLAFHSTQPLHGGTGAVYVLIQKNVTAKWLSSE